MNYEKMVSMFQDMAYRAKTGMGINDTLNMYRSLAGLGGIAVGAILGGYVANEATVWMAPDMPNAVRYAIDGISALAAGGFVGSRTHAIGLKMGIKKVKRVLNENE